jgi:hypothetical protein
MPESLNESLKKLANLYVLEALTDTERSTFEKELAQNESLQSLVKSLEGTLDVTNRGVMPSPDEIELQSQRHLLKANISSFELEKKQTPSLLNRLTVWFQTPMPAWVNLASVAAAFFIGIYIVEQPAAIETSPQPNIKELLQSGQLGQIKFAENGHRDDHIRFAVESRQDLELSGAPDDELVTDLLLYLLLRDQNPGKRLKAVKLLQNSQPAEDTKMALVSSLLTDPNPGVRLKSIRLLASYDPGKVLKEACMKVLLEDDNEAVRLSAMDIMEISPDKTMIPALQVVSVLDENDFIRERATELLTTFSPDELETNVEHES